MRRNGIARLLAAGLTIMIVPASLYATAAPKGNVKTRIGSLIHESGADAVGVAYRDLKTGEEILIRPDEVFHAASTMKVPVMMELFRLAKEGKLSLDDRITIKNDFASLADGSHFALSPEDDADQTLYKRIGETETIRGLIEIMITNSGNLATNLLLERIGGDRVNAYMKELGAGDIVVRRGVMDNKAFEKGLNNTVTARNLARIFTLLAERKAVSPEASDEMVVILKRQKHNAGIPAGLPAGTPVAHKTGWFTGVSHDAGIVYPPGRKPYVLVVLTRGIQDEKRANQLIADIARLVCGAAH